MTIGIWILGDRVTTKQLNLKNNQSNKQQIPVIFIESSEYVKQRPYHHQKLVLVRSAMRHCAAELKADNWQVTYKIAANFVTPLQDWIAANHITELQITTPCDLPFNLFYSRMSAWFHSAFIDAYNWVMQTNVIGMGQFADGGVLASKPYAASANYIN